MKDVALIAVNMVEDYGSCENAATAIENSIKFLEQIEPVGQDTDEVIFGTFPILLVGNFGKELEVYAQEGMSFQLNENILESANSAEQSLREVLDLLDIHNAYICGMDANKEIKQLCTQLSKIEIRPYLIENAIGYSSIEDYSAFLEEMKASGVKVTGK